MQWYVRVNDSHVGPITESEVRSRFQNGEINLSTPVWREGMADFKQLGTTELIAVSKQSFQEGSAPASKKLSPAQCYLAAWLNYATFEGRSSRREYWFFVLGQIVMAIILGAAQAILEVDVIVPLFCLASTLPSLAIAARRLHDVGKSGWFQFFPIYNLILVCQNGDTRPNQFG